MKTSFTPFTIFNVGRRLGNVEDERFHLDCMLNRKGARQIITGGLNETVRVRLGLNLNEEVINRK